MSVIDSLNETTETATTIGERYVKRSHQYLRLKIFQQVTLSMSLLAKVMLIGGMLFVGLIFSSVALAMEIGNSLNNIALGYLLVGAIYMVLALLIYLIRKRINKIIIRKIGHNFFT